MALPEGCFSYLEVLDDEYWALKGCPPDVASAELRRVYRITRILEDKEPAKVAAEEAFRSGLLARLHEGKRSALCFSGGGIRSATFGLGILQGLAARSVHCDGT